MVNSMKTFEGVQAVYFIQCVWGTCMRKLKCAVLDPTQTSKGLF